MKPSCAILLLALLPLLAACAGPTATTDGSTATPQVDNMEIIALPELQPYLDAIVKGDSSVNWIPSNSSPGSAGDSVTGKAVRAAIKTEGARLANVDYSALSMPAFVTATRSLKLTPDSFTGDQVRLDSTGTIAGENRWALYSWQGPEIPQLPDRQQVFRWVTVYALYDLKQNKVTRLLATVRGEARE